MLSENKENDVDTILKKEFVEHIKYQNKLKYFQETIVNLQDSFIRAPQCLCNQHAKAFVKIFDKIFSILIEDQSNFMNKEEAEKKINEIKTSYRAAFVFCAN